MTNLDNLARNLIKNSIKRLFKIFSEYPNIFLTEDDVRCHLFNIMVNNYSHLSETQKTKNGSFSIPVHSEVRWYGSSGKLKYRSDIVLLDPTNLRVKDQPGPRLPSKGYTFNGYYAIIETKLRRTKGYSDKKFLTTIKEDISKLKRIKEETEDYNKIKEPIYCLVCLDKKNDLGSDVKNIKKFRIKPRENIFLEYAFQNKD
jgi:hypothetical protein